MQPWKISVGVTAAIVGATLLIAGSRLAYLSPHWPLVVADYGLVAGLHLALAITSLAVVIYVVARTTGLADLGSRIDLAERSVRRGEGDESLAEALQQDAAGEWE